VLQRHRHTLVALLLVVLSAGVTALRYQRSAGDPIDVDFTQAQMPAMVQGFSAREPWGRWSDGPRGQVAFRRSLPSTFRLSMMLQGFGPNVGQSLTVRAGAVTRRVPIPGPMSAVDVVFTDVAPMTQALVFEVPAPTSPRALGVSTDLRRLGVGISRMSIAVP